ncbi:hypothetical protein RIR_jg28857.t1 [Rhizophagus irregularis DAOM 181602=DAOM 197198]|nr:hypothetical protein RIR_jg28857.t1 [Rhizophagus irregularis DAOM 181602=DAOM 197198]CAG8470351.1 15943_t:CDS:2 [Rhizophagus irregularis]
MKGKSMLSITNDNERGLNSYYGVFRPSEGSEPRFLPKMSYVEPPLLTAHPLGGFSGTGRSPLVERQTVLSTEIRMLAHYKQYELLPKHISWFCYPIDDTIFY